MHIRECRTRIYHTRIPSSSPPPSSGAQLSHLETLDAKSHVVYIHQFLDELTNWSVSRRLVQKLMVLRLLRALGAGGTKKEECG